MNKYKLLLLLVGLTFATSGLCAPDESINLTLSVASQRVSLGENPRPVLSVRNESSSPIAASENAIGVTQVVLRRDGSKVEGEVGKLNSFDSIADTVRSSQRQLAPGETLEVVLPTIGRAESVGLLESQPMNSDGTGNAGLRWTRWIDRPGTYELTVFYRKDLSSTWTASNSVVITVTP